MPKLVVVSGPSGVGKTTVCDLLLARDAFERVITATTRAPRGGERDGIDYHFLDDATFDAWIADGRFLEWANVYGRKYGSPRAHAEEILACGRFPLLNIDVQGAAAIADDCVRVFLLPPSFAELEQRLRDRGTDDAEVVERRLATAKAELARQDEFDLTVVNDDARRAADEIATAVLS
ncbi:MAG: guanylate kinase [Planctomycetota bacterium]